MLCKTRTSARADVVEVAAPMQRPKLVQVTAPELTEEIVSAGVDGVVVLRCVITKDGSVEDCCILRGINGLNTSVFAAVRTWRYEPVVVSGEPVAIAYIIQVKIVSSGKKRIVPFPPSR